MIARMWEVRSTHESVDALVEWLRRSGLPQIESDPDHVHSDVYRSRERVVVITTWRSRAKDLPAPPESLVARPPHAWDFTPVDRENNP